MRLKPHKSIDQLEFARQYCKNQKWWDKAFTFLRTHDLQQLKPGKYVIEDGNVIAFVSDAPTKNMEVIQWETHQNFNDLQYVISGKAKMGIASTRLDEHSTTLPYDPKKDVANYSVKKGKFYTAKPGSFFIFSPLDIHRPAFKVKGYDSIKKILIKVRVP
jgi:YhcH/YjgK/YiaL family protein